MPTLRIDRFASPIGEIIVVVDGAQLCALDYGDCEERLFRLLYRRYGASPLVPVSNPHTYSTRILAYMAGDLRALDAIKVRTGGTPFQEQVWRALRTIPPGTVMTYGCMATYLGHPGAARAVGAANALNPVSIVLPCHRLVGSDGSLTGYAGGLERKAWLLRHEGVTCTQDHLSTAIL
jgi:O-6-methylguanine DNA methyltransferase